MTTPSYLRKKVPKKKTILIKFDLVTFQLLFSLSFPPNWIQASQLSKAWNNLKNSSQNLTAKYS